MNEEIKKCWYCRARVANSEAEIDALRTRAEKAEALLDECLKPLEFMAQNEQYHGSKKKAQKYLDLAAEIRAKREGE
jgi:hypothetical protein